MPRGDTCSSSTPIRRTGPDGRPPGRRRAMRPNAGSGTPARTWHRPRSMCRCVRSRRQRSSRSAPGRVPPNNHTTSPLGSRTIEWPPREIGPGAVIRRHDDVARSNDQSSSEYGPLVPPNSRARWRDRVDDELRGPPWRRAGTTGALGAQVGPRSGGRIERTQTAVVGGCRPTRRTPAVAATRAPTQRHSSAPEVAHRRRPPRLLGATRDDAVRRPGRVPRGPRGGWCRRRPGHRRRRACCWPGRLRRTTRTAVAATTRPWRRRRRPTGRTRCTRRRRGAQRGTATWGHGDEAASNKGSHKRADQSWRSGGHLMEKPAVASARSN